MAEKIKTNESVHATVELAGEYEEIASIIGERDREYAEIAVAVDDIESVLDIVVRTGGATKSGIVEALPPDVSAEIDVEAVIHVLRVLELYDLVSLDGNTWRPGDALSQP